MINLVSNFPMGSVTAEQVRNEALRLTSSGLSIIPIIPGGSKVPALSKLRSVWDESRQNYRKTWKPYQREIAAPAEVDWFFSDRFPGTVPGIGVICGKVSGNLEVIDVDDWPIAESLQELIRKRNPSLLERLVLVQSPRPGLHLYYRCDNCGHNRKLAYAPDPKTQGMHPKGIIEVKAEGGICLAPGSPPHCHITGRPYQYLQRHLTEVPRISVEERQFLEECARQLNTWQRPAQRTPPKPAFRLLSKTNRRPGDFFNRHASWDEVLCPHGWTQVMTSGDMGYWRRPGKLDGHSATTNYEGSNLLYVFSSNAAPLESDTTYSKFAAMTFLRFKGNFHAATQYAHTWRNDTRFGWLMKQSGDYWEHQRRLELLSRLYKET